MSATVMLLITSKTDAVFQMTSDGGLKIFTGGLPEFIPIGRKLLIKDIEWAYEISDAKKAAYSGKSFSLKLTLRSDEYEVFLTASTLPSSGRIAGQHYLAQGIEVSNGPSLRMKMWFGGGDSGFDKGNLRMMLRGTLVKA
jgi:hypothetical protein